MQDIENRIKNLIDSLEFRKKELLNSNKDNCNYVNNHSNNGHGHNKQNGCHRHNH